ncbi:hypothetical protein DL764_008763 [Monosporascus ibericus]|uniref:Rhamnogalacturonase A/B/Epimerase-like pectate lyase domain-containing protein n=1 Tax=Monosporascus ibericus TaxID=155417 RepID=A0A4Q4SWR8_9PEZI|nr:hypothetical protein DL764_008763 [Monosporascus ibericus]
MPSGPVGSSPPLPVGPPQPAPSYMRDNTLNQYGTAPDRGTMDGPYLGSGPLEPVRDNNETSRVAADDGFWLSTLGPLGISPFAPEGYQFFRNVKDFGTVGDGVTDDTAAINRAMSSLSQSNQDDLRCGLECGSSSVLNAVVYFPSGTYLITKPIIMYFHTQMVGNPSSRPIIQGSANFSGIALVDANPYVPGGNGRTWYVNQSNFFRQIRNFVFSMKGMARHNWDGDQEYVPAGIHWTIGQATSIANCDFQMDVSTAEGSATAVGIFMENGSGGSVSDLTFFGESSDPPQGTGSITVLDSHFNGVPYAITVAHQEHQYPSIVLDNLLVENSESVVLVSGGETLLPGSGGPLWFNSWMSGYQVLPDGYSGRRTGFVGAKPNKPTSLLGGQGGYFYRSKPQYDGAGLVVATEHGISNDATGDQTSAINALLRGNVGSIVFFPGGVYLVKGTVEIPVGSKIVGSGWSQIMATGSYFADEFDPKVMARVGQPGDSGVIEISDMLFTTKEGTAGCILMEWNVHESHQGSAAIWDSHFRVGGGGGTDLLLEDCPIHTSSPIEDCKAATMMLHMTKESSGFFDNVWVWVADHDLDDPLNAEAFNGKNGIPENVYTQSMTLVSIYVGRGVLIESDGPTWFWGGGSEHAQLYQWQLLDASNIVMGHLQTETPYYQDNPTALEPYTVGEWPADPRFEDCAEDFCKKAWAMRILNSTDVFLYGLGFYSFFQDNNLGCALSEECQLSFIDTNYAERVWMYNIFTKGNVEIVSPEGGIPPLLFNDTTRNGYTSNVAAWLALALEGGDRGSSLEPGSGEGSGVVYIDPDLWEGEDGDGTVTVQCYDPFTTSLEVGWLTDTTYVFDGETITTTVFVTVVQMTVLTIPPMTTSIIPLWNVNITEGETSITIKATTSLLPPPITITNDPDPEDNGSSHPTNTRTITPKPWPWPTDEIPTTTTTRTTTEGDDDDDDDDDDDGEVPIVIVHTRESLHLVFNRYLQLTPYAQDFWDEDNPNRPNPDNPGEPDPDCTTSTYSSCQTLCIPTPTQSCSSTCSRVIGCSTTGTDIEATITPAPGHGVYMESYEPWFLTTPSFEEYLDAAQDVLEELSSLDGFPDFDSTSEEPPPPTTSTSEIPIPTNPPAGNFYCFREHNDDGRWGGFTDPEAVAIVEHFCSNEPLSPSNTFGYASRDSQTGVLVSVTWADDQTGCKAKSEMPMGEWCIDTISIMLLSCDLQLGEPYYGGAFVDNADYGCVRWWMGADTLAALAPVPDQGPQPLPPSEQEAHLEQVSELEPQLPRISRELRAKNSTTL